MLPPGPPRPKPWRLEPGTISWNTDAMLAIEDLDAYLRLSKSTLYKLAHKGKAPGQKVGRHWRFHKDAIDGWLKTHPKPSGDDTPPRASPGRGFPP